MSTVAAWSADAAPPDAVPNAKPGFLQRLIMAREKEVRGRIQQFLVMQSDERLMDLGYAAEDVRKLRQG